MLAQYRKRPMSSTALLFLLLGSVSRATAYANNESDSNIGRLKSTVGRGSNETATKASETLRKTHSSSEPATSAGANASLAQDSVRPGATAQVKDALQSKTMALNDTGAESKGESPTLGTYEKAKDLSLGDTKVGTEDPQSGDTNGIASVIAPTPTSCPVDKSSIVIKGPSVTTHLDVKKGVNFSITMKWAPRLRMMFHVRQKNRIYFEEFYGKEDTCGSVQSKMFRLQNRPDPGVEPDHPSFERELTAYLSVGTHFDADRAHCLDQLCETYTLSYDFLPSSRNIKLSYYPHDIRAGGKGVVECSTTDGSPVAEPFAIRIIDHVTGKPVLVANVSRLEMLSTGAGTYQCMVLSRAFGRETVVISEMSLNVVPPETKTVADEDKIFAPSPTRGPIKRAGEEDGFVFSNPMDGWLTDDFSPSDEDDSSASLDTAAMKDVKEIKDMASRAELAFGLIVCTTLVLLLERTL